MTSEGTTAAPVSGPRVHDIGAGGTVVIVADANDVRIQGVDGTEARVVAPADGVGIATEAQPGRFSVRTVRYLGTDRTGFVGLRLGSREFGFPLGFRASESIEIEVPRDARVEIGSASGEVALRDVRGGTVVRTASGDVSIKGAGGTISVNVASGDVSVIGTEPVSLDVHSVSGDVRARAPKFDRVAIETISGDAELAGSYEPGPSHRISTVSGDVELAVSGGLTLEVKTVSGDVDCHHPDRREGDGRRRPLVIGDGAARLAVRSMSGDVEVRATPSGPPTPARPAPLAPPISPAVSSAPTRAPSAPGGDAPATLAILEALSRGEIDVSEAERRLGPADAPPGAAPHA